MESISDPNYIQKILDEELGNKLSELESINDEQMKQIKEIKELMVRAHLLGRCMRGWRIRWL